MPTTTEHRAQENSTADDDLAFAGLVRLAELLSRGQVTPRELTEFYLARIERIDQHLGAFIFVRADEVTTRGNGARHEPAPADSEIVRRLRAAGAIVLGKTVLSELAAWGHFTSSKAFGVTRNPWKLGSDGGGSIRIPAAFCGCSE